MKLSPIWRRREPTSPYAFTKQLPESFHPFATVEVLDFIMISDEHFHISAHRQSLDSANEILGLVESRNLICIEEAR